MRLLCLAIALAAPAVLAQPDLALPDAVAGCTACHLKEGVPGQPGWPRLAGKEKSEIIGILRGHRAHLIPDSTMSKVAAGLSDDEIEQVADYYSKLEPSDPPPMLLKKPARKPATQ